MPAEPAGGVAIRVEGVSKAFGGDPARIREALAAGLGREAFHQRTGAVLSLDRVGFEVARGEIVVVMGLSGCGKSTLLRCLNRLVEPSAGRITIEGADVLGLSRAALTTFRRRHFGMVFQNFALLPYRSILANAAFGLELQGLPRAAREEKAREALALVGLAGWEAKLPHELSGGMQQRAGLARALAVDPAILLMDEAFSALDPLIRRDMQGELRQLQTRLKKTIVFVSHDFDEAIALGGRIVLMKDGRIAQIGTAEDLVLSPADDYVARFTAHVDRASVITLRRLARGGTAPVGAPNADAALTLRTALPLIAAHPAGITVSDAGRAIGTLTQADALAAIAGAGGDR
jgi:glycine betaine/proline transport system ATP-binding protein